MGSPREITPHVTGVLACGEFHQGRNYANWRPQGSGDCLLLFTLEGAGRLVVDGRPQILGKRQALLYRPEASQDYATDPAAGRWRLRWVHFKPEPRWESWLAWPEIGRGVGRLEMGEEAASRFASALHRMLAAQRHGGAHATSLALNALEEALIWAHRELAGDQWLELDPRIRKAAAYLAADLARPFSLPDLARHSGLSASRLSHLFKKQVQLTPREYGEKLRLELAAQLLVHTGLAVSEVADRAGFADPLYFSRRFRKFFGGTPKAMRLEYQQGKARPS